jgi:hypothetical protein
LSNYHKVPPIFPNLFPIHSSLLFGGTAYDSNITIEMSEAETG